MLDAKSKRIYEEEWQKVKEYWPELEASSNKLKKKFNDTMQWLEEEKQLEYLAGHVVFHLIDKKILSEEKSRQFLGKVFAWD